VALEYGKLIFKCRVGSHLYGLNTPKSDEDFVSVFIPKSEYLLGLKKVEEVDASTKSSSSEKRNTSEDVDDKAYALPKFMHLLLQNNPNIVELLFANEENILTLEPEFKYLIDNYEKIVSQKVYHTFTGYAFSQERKLTVKAERYKSLEKSIRYIERNFNLNTSYELTEEEADKLNRRLKYYKGKKNSCESFHKGMDILMIYDKIKSEYDNYGWRVKTDTFLKLNYDVKFGYHIIRILNEGADLLTNGKLEFPFTGKIKELCVNIKNGRVTLDSLYKIFYSLNHFCDRSLEITKLPKTPDFSWANDWLVETLKKSICSTQ
jgi:hypothetical protein